MSLRYKLKPVKNARFPDENPLYSVSLIRGSNIKLDKLAKQMSELSAFSPGDLSGLIDNLVLLLTQHLSSGDSVTLDGFGTFSLSAELKSPVTDPDKITGHDVRIKRICFKPSPDFKRRIEEEASFKRYKEIR